MARAPIYRRAANVTTLRTPGCPSRGPSPPPPASRPSVLHNGLGRATARRALPFARALLIGADLEPAHDRLLLPILVRGVAGFAELVRCSVSRSMIWNSVCTKTTGPSARAAAGASVEHLARQAHRHVDHEVDDPVVVGA